MFPPGTILYFTPFYFKDNKTPAKNKYFISLGQKDNNLFLATLPSSQDYVPAYASRHHGCINIADANFNCYYFEAEKIITTNGWAFPKPTYSYANWIDEYNQISFEDQYAFEGIDYEQIGRLTETEFHNLIKCFVTAPNIKNKYKRILERISY